MNATDASGSPVAYPASKVSSAADHIIADGTGNRTGRIAPATEAGGEGAGRLRGRRGGGGWWRHDEAQPGSQRVQLVLVQGREAGIAGQDRRKVAGGGGHVAERVLDDGGVKAQLRIDVADLKGALYLVAGLADPAGAVQRPREDLMAEIAR